VNTLIYKLNQLKKNSPIRILFLVVFLLSLVQTAVFAQYIRRNSYYTEHQRRLQYALDDWTSYLEGKQVNSMVVGTSYIYFGTLDGGILRYHLFQNFWDYPYTTSNGLSGNRILEVTFDEGSGIVGAITQSLDDPYSPTDTCIFVPAENEWHNKSREYLWNFRFPAQQGIPEGSSIKQNIFYPRNYLNLLPSYFANGGYTMDNDWILLDDRFDEFRVSSFLVDFWERVWFAIDELGVGIGNTFSQRLDVFSMGLTHISPRTVKYFYDDLWIGGVGLEGDSRPGITRWRNSDGSWENYQARYIMQLPSDNVWDIEVASDSIWFATDFGVSLLNDKKNRWKNFGLRDGLYSNEVNDLLISDSMVYVGTESGLNTIHCPTGIVKREKDENIHLATVYQIARQDSIIWLATNRGIFNKNISGNKWKAVITTSPIQDLPVYAVEVFGDEVWFASSGGIFWYDTSLKKWESFPQIGFELQVPYRDMVVNEKSVWVGTPEGLLKYDRKRLYWILFTTEDGLLDNDCYQLLMDGDYLWIATASGICQFYWNNPSRID
jgi:hypothetical protein